MEHMGSLSRTRRAKADAKGLGVPSQRGTALPLLEDQELQAAHLLRRLVNLMNSEFLEGDQKLLEDSG